VSRVLKAIIIGVATSIVAYVSPILAWGYIHNGTVGTALFTGGIILSAPGFFAIKILGLQQYWLRVLIPVAINGTIYALLWMGIFKLFAGRLKPREQGSNS
jgi:hypothetical protein